MSNDFDTRFQSAGTAAEMARRFPGMHDAARNLWNTAMDNLALTPRMKELVLLAIFASPAGYDQAVVDMQIDRATQAGASAGDVADVLVSVAGIANHALYFALPLAEEAFSKEEILEGVDDATLSAVQRLKDDFVKVRGFWNPERDVLGRVLPDYLVAAGNYSTAAARHGSLTAAEREMIYISVDASVNHMSELGLRIHFRNARKAGVAFKQVAAVLKIVGVVGFLAYIRSSRHLAH
ncbi:carboxymuconolactone decarboxylase family protein [Achromobacter veterisilvae]|uniref:Carboxymuconolactone decarboxylase family protein n=1 Tax=Achromobacter veterisilvae TaxID=2069367 RepID=A0ABZ2RWU3_9BURK|nr:carboxymuconolactone decarboxylase family protein [Achromobacter sp.]MCW0210376.1 carboxymuconolactone decarboxylase family protein [Achromobacter sp.]